MMLFTASCWSKEGFPLLYKDLGFKWQNLVQVSF